MASRSSRHSTRVLLLSTCSVLLATLPAVACSESEEPATGGAGGSTGTGGKAASGRAAGMGGATGTGGTVQLTINACETDGISISCERPAQGVELCEDGTDKCALTNELGASTIMLPLNREVAYTMTKEGHNSYLECPTTTTRTA